MPSTLPAEQQRYCLGCGYQLNDLPEPRCPECGEGFDIENPRTYAFQPKPNSFVLWLAKPAGWPTYAAAVVLSLAILASGSVPGQVFSLTVDACLGSILLGGLIVLGLIVRAVVFGSYGRFRELRGNRWVIAPAIVISAAIISGTHLPLILVFRLSQPAMSRFAAEVQPLSPGMRIPDRWIGFYPATYIEKTATGVRFEVSGARQPPCFGGVYSFEFISGSPPRDQWGEQYSQLGGGWYIRHLY